MKNNQIHTITPFKKNGVWMFNDMRVGLNEEAFVAGADDMIEVLTEGFDIEDAEDGFTLQFSSNPFPDAQVRLDRVRYEFGGTWYRLSGPVPMEGWLCPALNLYYKTSPAHLYVAVKEKK